MLSPQKLLSSAARERCVSKLRELPSAYLHKDTSPTVNASVLLPLCVVNGEVCLLYTLRSSNLKNHSGQVSFPGGKMDENEDVVETALRETEEEIGVPRGSIDVWGQMAKVQGRDKNILITPVVGLIKDFDIKRLQCNIDEVQEVFTVPMSSFCDINNHAYLEFQTTILPIFLYQKYKIWGITGFITHFFLQCFLPSSIYNVDFLRKRFEMHELMPSKL